MKTSKIEEKVKKEAARASKLTKKATKVVKKEVKKDMKIVKEVGAKAIVSVNAKAKKMINDGIISGGMIPKINNCLDVAKNGVKGVCIIDGKKKHSILFELLSDKGSGTLIRE